MEVMLLMNRIKCWCYYPLQVLRAAPALHSLIVCRRRDVADILEFLNPIQGGLRKLILDRCSLGDDNTGVLANIVALYPDLEGLSLEWCRQLTPAGYRLIARLKKLSELDPFFRQVDYVCVCVKLLETHVCICEHVAEHP